MGKIRAMTRIAAIGAAIAGAIFFWRRRHPPEELGPPTASDRPDSSPPFPG